MDWKCKFIILYKLLFFKVVNCFNFDNYHEIISQKEDFYKVKSEFEKKLDNFEYSGIEWRPFSYLNLNEEQSKAIIEILELLEELDDVQSTYTNVNFEKIKIWKLSELIQD